MIEQVIDHGCMERLLEGWMDEWIITGEYRIVD